MIKDMYLLKITVVIDDSTDIWSEGSLDYEAMLGALTEYLRDRPENRIKLADWLEMLSKKCRDDEAPFQV